jgi:uncharacterized protein
MSSLVLDLHSVRSSHERYEKVFDRADFRTTDDYAVVAPVSLSFDIFKDRETFRLVGTVRTTLELSCSRCLEPFALPVEAQFDLRYQPRAMNTGEDDREIEEDDLSTAFYENEEIDLGGLMREQFYLALPMKPLCGTECRGLCPMCGMNLNRSACQCKPEWSDPRFAALRALKTPDTTKTRN